MDFDFDDMDMPEAPEWTPTPEEVAECAQWADMAEDNGVDFGFSEDEDDIETPKKQIENHLLTPETDVILRRAADELDLLPRNLEKFQSPFLCSKTFELSCFFDKAKINFRIFDCYNR